MIINAKYSVMLNDNITHNKNSEDEGYLSLIKGVLWGTCDKKPLQYVTLS